MKRIIKSAFVILLTFGAANAQTTQKSKEHKKEHRKGGFDGLNLSADQQAQMKTLRAEFRKQAADLKANTQLSDADKKARRQELHQQHKAQVEAILTPAQKDAVARKKAEWKAAGKEGKKGTKRGQFTNGRKGSSVRGTGFEKDLNLSTDQQAKMNRIRTDFRSKFESLRSDKALTKEEKKNKMKELKKEQKEQVKAVLTKEQVEKIQSLRKDRRARISK